MCHSNMKKIFIVCIMILSFYGCSKSNNEDDEVEKTITVSTKDGLKLEDDWKSSTKDGYIYIEGTITNTNSNKTIHYYEIEARFCDCSEELMDYSRIENSSALKPGESRKFEIVHERPTFYRTIKLLIKKVE